MRAVDTNVLVRLITRDDPAQVEAAQAYIAAGVRVSTLALAETIWVLRSTYGQSAVDQVNALRMLLGNAQVAFEDRELVEAALEEFDGTPGLSFSDCLIVQSARKAGDTLGTFDRKLAKVEGTELIGKSSNQPPHRARSRRS